MSIIVPAGKKNVVWSPVAKKDASLVKTAGVEPGVPDGTGPHGGTDQCPCVESDPLFDAAKEFADQAGKGDDSVVEVKTVGDEETEEKGQSDLKEAVEEVKEAVEKVEEAVSKVEVAEEAEIEVEVEDAPEDKKVEEVEIEVEDVPGEQEVSSGEVMVTSAPENCACAKTDKEEVKKEAKEEVKEAAVEEEFCRFGKLSPVNKKKVADYWVNALGFPKDYVNLMVKDYEK